jgi:hypothetical protein
MKSIIRKLEDLIPFDKDWIWVFTPGIIICTVIFLVWPECINKLVLAIWAFLALFALFIYIITPED